MIITELGVLENAVRDHGFLAFAFACGRSMSEQSTVERLPVDGSWKDSYGGDIPE